MVWKFFIVGVDKTPLPNCAECRAAGPEHDREVCDHLTCHGFYAATDDAGKLAEMLLRYPHGHWAVRTGEASGIIVLDAEGGVDPAAGVSGVEVLDNWETWTNGLALPHTPLVAETPSGGVHRFHRWEPGVRSRNRILPGVDVKSDGGYVLVPSEGVGGRHWISRGVPGVLDEANLEWLRRSRGHTRSDGVNGERPVGYDYDRFILEGCPGGCRDEFFNDLIFRLRKAGVMDGVAVQEIRRHWERCAQPPEARWYMPWRHVEYKIDRIWRTVEPDVVAQELQDWARTASRITAVTTQGRGTVIMQFTAWLTLQRDRNDRIGNIAREFIDYDDCVAIVNATPEFLRTHMVDVHDACDDAVESLELAAREWRSDR